MLEVVRSAADTLELKLTGRVDAVNADQFRDEYQKIRKDNQGSNVVFDASDFEYISSAGLRVFLGIRSSEKSEVSIINVSDEVFDIFYATGFTSMLDIQRVIKEYGIPEGAVLIGKGANAEVYRIDPERVLKLYSSVVPINEIRREQSAAKKAFLAGIPTAISYNVVKSGDRYGIIFELLNAESLASFLKKNPDRIDEYAEKYYELLKMFHDYSGDTGIFPNSKTLHHAYWEGVAEWFTPDEYDILGRVFDSIPDGRSMIHGDFHPGNIMVQNGEMIVIDMGTISIGHPIFDLMSSASSHVVFAEANPQYIEQIIGMPVDMIKKLWRYVIDRYFEGRSKEDISRIEKDICLYSQMKFGFVPVLGKGLPPEILKMFVDMSKQVIRSEGDSLIGRIDW